MVSFRLYVPHQHPIQAVHLLAESLYFSTLSPNQTYLSIFLLYLFIFYCMQGDKDFVEQALNIKFKTNSICERCVGSF